MALPRQLSLRLFNRKLLNFKTKEVPPSQKLSGTSKKAIFYNEEDPSAPWFVKQPKERPENKILPEDIAPSLYKARRKLAHLNEIDNHNSPKLYKLKNKVKKEVDQTEKQYKEHRQSLRDSQFFLEALSPRIADAIFGNFLAVPENYFYKEDDDHSPLILSKGIKNFREFLSEEPIVENKTVVKDWENSTLPLRNQLHLNPEKAEALGKLLFIALLMGHLDILNNINLTNSGVVEEPGKKLIPAIVDWGNTFGVGFEGKSEDECAWKNPDLFSGKIDLKHPDIAGFQHCVPFDTIVYPLLPRQIVQDLFNLTDKNSISEAMLNGFEQACIIAKEKLSAIDTLIPTVIETVFNQYTAVTDINKLKNILNHEMFFPTEKQQKDGYTLANILKGRINSLVDILRQLKEGVSLEQIGQNRLDEIIKLQHYTKPTPSYSLGSFKIGFFSHQKDNKASHYRETEHHLLETAPHHFAPGHSKKWHR